MSRAADPIGVVGAAPGSEVHLLAGQLYFGREARRVRTLLGSCVAVVLWHRARRVGGMCHFLLPERPSANRGPLDARFGVDALQLLMQAVEHTGTRPSEYETHLYGGADTMPDSAGVRFDVGERNIERGWSLPDRCGFTLQHVDVGDRVPRTVVMDMQSGDVTMRRGMAIGGTA